MTASPPRPGRPATRPPPRRAGAGTGALRVHLDTDFAGDPDDACALAMLLGWDGVDIVGITTTADPDGRRAGYVGSFLALAGRADIPVIAGAGRSSTTRQPMGGLPDHDRYWGFDVEAAPAPAGAAVELLRCSIGQGATIVAIGPFTNLAALERRHPGGLVGVPVTAMGGWVRTPAPGLPMWGPDGTGTSRATRAPHGWSRPSPI